MFGAVCTLIALAQGAAESAPKLQWVSTEHMGRLTNTARNPIAAHGLAGTDLGVSFEAHGKLVFLFGDSWTLDRKDWDGDSLALAKSSSLLRGEMPALEWLTRPDGRFLPLAPTDMRLGGMDVPVEGLAIGARTFIFFNAGYDKKTRRHTHSILAHADRLDFTKLALDHSVTSDKFLNISAVVDDATVWLFGTGQYRKSGVYLARVALADFANRKAWRYAPDFVVDEKNARPIVVAGDLGEISVRRFAKHWLMACNGSNPRGIQLRVAAQPAGPWSEPIVIFEPGRERAYGRFMHLSTRAAGSDDGLSEAGREDESGGEYGPYLVPQWSSSVAPGVHALVYTLSTWNPYQVHLMRTLVAEPEARVPQATPPAAPRAMSAKQLQNPRFEEGSFEHWTSEGDAFTSLRHIDGSWEVCTFTEAGRDGVRGRLWQEFCVPIDAHELRCTLRGGTESLRLSRGAEVLRESRGPRSNDVAREVRWSLEEFRGQVLRLEIVDDSSAPWGFVTVRGIEIVRS